MLSVALCRRDLQNLSLKSTAHFDILSLCLDCVSLYCNANVLTETRFSDCFTN